MCLLPWSSDLPATFGRLHSQMAGVHEKLGGMWNSPAVQLSLAVIATTCGVWWVISCFLHSFTDTYNILVSTVFTKHLFKKFVEKKVVSFSYLHFFFSPSLFAPRVQVKFICQIKSFQQI